MVAIPLVEPLDEKNIVLLHIDWHLQITNYSPTNLTFPNKDKLAAIAALATRYGRVLNCPYAGGLFQSDLPLGLLWGQPNILAKVRKPCTGDEWTFEEGWQEEILPDSQRDSDY